MRISPKIIPVHRRAVLSSDFTRQSHRQLMLTSTMAMEVPEPRTKNQEQRRHQTRYCTPGKRRCKKCAGGKARVASPITLAACASFSTCPPDATSIAFLRVSTCRRWSSNPSGKCSYQRPTRGTVCGTMRSMCGADAGCLAINYQSLSTCTASCSAAPAGLEQV